MQSATLLTIARRELREALRNRWLVFYALAFAGLAFALSLAGQASAGYSGLGGFGRTAASLVNAILLFVPLLGLSVGAGSLAGDRERGTLMYLLAQPVNRADVFFGKALGAALAMVVSLGLGFGLAALGLATAGDGNPAGYLALAGNTLLLALIALGLGFVISALSKRVATALGVSDDAGPFAARLRGSGLGSLKRSHRDTARSLGISPGAMASVMSRATAIGLTWDAGRPER